MRIEMEPYDGPGATLLVPLVQQEYVVRYGGPDETPVESGEFAPPGGAFYVGYDDAGPVACGGYRQLTPAVAELKRMYVAERARRRGLGRALLARIEADARAAGYRELRLETGWAQPEAIALYTSSGYTPVARFGIYACAEGSRYFGKPL